MEYFGGISLDFEGILIYFDINFGIKLWRIFLYIAIDFGDRI